MERYRQTPGFESRGRTRGESGQGRVRLGKVRLGAVRSGMAREVARMVASTVRLRWRARGAWQGNARRGAARLGLARLAKARSTNASIALRAPLSGEVPS